MLLEALVACAGVTLSAVATSLGFSAIRLSFELDTEASEEQVETLVRLTERYCVVLQTLREPPGVSTSYRRLVP
jgi:uncharacterized OsmC-like protein